MNLSRVTIVASIENFNPKKGYPEFDSRPTKVESEPVVSFTPVAKDVPVKVTPKWKKNKIKAIKRAKRAFKSNLDADYKPVLITSNKLV